MKTLRFGRMQHRIMQFLWTRGKANARDITDALGKDEPVAHSTVQTLLRKLEQKGAIAHELDDRTFVFYPLVEEHKVTRSSTREFIDRIFGGSVVGLVAHLLEHEKIPKKELDQIKKLIDENK
jgi:BlaI family transcriptional regulator, penicillinase repressor